jgi:UrcA family protein
VGWSNHARIRNKSDIEQRWTMESGGRRVQLHTRKPTDPIHHKEIAMNTFTRLASTAFLALTLNAAYGEEAPKSLTVQFADLDLNKDAGLARLFDRIKGAAERVCSAHSGGTTLRDRQQYAACVEFALSNAIARVDRPELTEYIVSRYSGAKTAPAKVATSR